METEVVAIGLHCKACQTQADIHHAYLHDNVMYIQGTCPECGDDVKFSTDKLLVSLMMANKGPKTCDRGVQ